MNSFPFTAVGFDLDGTLVDSARDLGPALQHALDAIGRPAVPAEDVVSLIGGGARAMLERGLLLTGGPLPARAFEAALAGLMDHYTAHIADHTVPYDGCLQALDDLAARGVALAVVTNKAEHLARLLLEKLDLTDRFAGIIGGDTLGAGRSKPRPDMIVEAIRLCNVGGRFAMVGDSTYDTGAARAAGVPSVALSFGYNDRPAAELGADAVIDHYDQLVPTLLRL
ncbi:phosphoglycolate phosphatase [Croceibacterium mercuriale]|uniref:Phosphoglycolate phosphatase n=1 Tax=Croceibacterium mercuriale TaxID=1572751 RepID=A0A0B2C0U3_9SPHN|nr:HAD-IA family hydrolase [Croceibacterium mercuriale]KHL25606.1 phosphoglycolate phosphatase [Croceibacterium mercuriale]